MDAAQWQQEMVMVKPPFMEDMVVLSSTRPQQMIVERRSRPQKDQPLNCPRCNSTNTKFCYYNNYSLTQPRYFCKTCRRYWTEGGSLRNVPVGGGSRKNKRSSSSSSSFNPPSSSSNPNPKKSTSDLLIASPPESSTNNTRFHESTGGHDLNLAFPQTHQLNLSGEYGDCQYKNLNTSSNNNNNPQTCSSSASSAATTLGISALGGTNALPDIDHLSSSSGMPSRSMMMSRFIPNSVLYPSGGFGLQNFRSAATLNFHVDGSTVGGGIGYDHQKNVQEGTGGDRLLFPFEGLSQVSSTNQTDQTENNPQQQFDQSRSQGGDSSGYWNGVMGNGTLW